MNEVSAGEFKAKCLKLMDQVKKTGRPIVVTKRGQPVVKLVPAHLPVFGCLRNSITITADIVAPIEERWDAE